MNERLGVILGFVKKEFAQVLRDPVMRVFVFVAPVIQLTIFGWAISNEFKNLRLAVFASPGDVMSARLAERFYASGWFVPAPDEGERDPERLLRSGRAHAVLVMPKEGLTRALGRNDAGIQLMIDASNATRARAVETYARAIARRFLADEGIGGAKPPSVVFDVRVLYNPTMQTAYFMVPGVMTLIVCIITILMTGMAIAREKEMGTLETIIAAPLANTDIILGKTLPYVLLGLADSALVITAGVTLFGVPVRGSLLLLILATLVFVCSTVSVGTLVSTIAKTQQQAMMGSFLVLFPATLLSGIFFPIENMPVAFRAVAYIDPLTYYVTALRNIMLKGANPELVWYCIGILAVMAAVFVTLAVNRFKQRLN